MCPGDCHFDLLIKEGGETSEDDYLSNAKRQIVEAAKRQQVGTANCDESSIPHEVEMTLLKLSVFVLA
jgi:hypothetical protein